MNLRRLLLGVLCSILITTPLLAQKEAPPAGGEPKDFSLPEKQSIALDNGLNATLVQYGALPKVAIRIVVRAGNLNESADEVWLADLTGRMMQEGTTTLGSQELAARFASMGGELSVSTGLDTMTVGATVLSEFAAEAATLLAEVARTPALPEAELDRIKGDMNRELSISMTRAQSQATERFYALLYGDHPYGRLYPTEEMLNGYGIEQLRAWHDTNFGAQRTRVYVVGRFDTAAVEAAIGESFNDWQPGEEALINPPEMQSGRRVHLIDRPDAPQSTIRLGLPTIGPSHEDYMALTVTNSLLGGSFGSRITTNIREDKGYTYSPSSSVSTRYRAAHWVQSADVTSEATGASLVEIIKEIDRLQAEAPSEEELAGIQNYLAGIFVLRNSSLGGIINQLSFLDLHGLDESYLTGYVGNIYSVTPERVRQTAETYLDDAQMTLVVVGDEAGATGQISFLGEVVTD